MMKSGSTGWFRCMLAAASLLFSDTALADKRVALVLGNSAYLNVAPLANPVNDSLVIASTLKDAGFDIVDFRRDLSAADTRRALRDFADRSRDADIAVVYYAGHGIEVDGGNYLIPIDARLERDTDVYDEALSLDRVLVAVEPAKKLRLVILDACRDNPFSRTMKRTVGSRAMGQGLAKVVRLSSGRVLVGVVEAQVVARLDHGADGVLRGVRRLSIRPITGAESGRRTALGGERDRPLGRGLGDADVHRHDQRHGDPEHGVPDRVPLAGRVGSSDTAASGTNTSSSTTVCEPVARMPIVSHVSSMLTPSAANGTAKWITCGPSGASSQRALVTRMSPAGAAAGRCLAGRDAVAALDRGRRAVATRSSPTAPVDTSTSCSLRHPGEHRCGQVRACARHTWAATRWVCIEQRQRGRRTAAGQERPGRRRSRRRSRRRRPAPRGRASTEAPARGTRRARRATKSPRRRASAASSPIGRGARRRRPSSQRLSSADAGPVGRHGGGHSRSSVCVS